MFPGILLNFHSKCRLSPAFGYFLISSLRSQLDTQLSSCLIPSADQTAGSGYRHASPVACRSWLAITLVPYALAAPGGAIPTAVSIGQIRSRELARLHPWQHQTLSKRHAQAHPASINLVNPSPTKNPAALLCEPPPNWVSRSIAPRSSCDAVSGSRIPRAFEFGHNLRSSRVWRRYS
jgi:hypothetical protein